MLSDLPFELLSEIVSYLPTAQAVSHLALSCRKLNEFVKKEGWKVFVQSRFPSIKLASQVYPNVVQSWESGAGVNGTSNGIESLSSNSNSNLEIQYWRDASHALTTLSRNYDRRAFIARYLEPSGSITYLPSGEKKQQWRRPRGQTMGYQPVIDSYEEWTANDWASRREVLAWSAGAELVVRVKQKGRPATELWAKNTAEQRRLYFDHYHHKIDWFTYKNPGSVEGRDDITAVKLLRSSEIIQRDGGNANQRIMIGTANGDLLVLALPLHNCDVPPPEPRITPGMLSASITAARFITNERSVHSADISPSDTALLAACLSGTRIAIYPTQNPDNLANIKPIDEITAVPEGRRGHRVWSTKFLSESRLAIGLGPSAEPVHVYEATPTGLNKDPIRKFGIDGTHWACDDRIDIRPATTRQSSSVYPITPIPETAQAGHGAGDTFLSGCYDGIIRLHDLRDPSAYTCSYWDPTDDSAIYSLVTLGRERLVAGSSRHSIVKFFDLRVSGGRCYHYTDVHTTPHASAPQTNGEACPSAKNNRCGWNLFINPRNRTFGGNRGANSWARRSAESPIYSLSSPSAASPSLFAGVENNVVQLDFVAMLDRHPDPVFADGIVRRPSNPPSAPRRGGFSRNPPALARGALRAALSVPKASEGAGDIDVKQTWDPRGDALNLAMYEQSSAAGGGVMRLRVQGNVAPVPRQARVLRGYDERWRDGSEV